MFKLPFARAKDTTDIKDPTNGHSIVDLRNVNKSYKTAVGDYPALKNINLQFNAGEFVSIIGKSGSGKSSLLNMITGIDHPTSGEVFVNGTPVHTMSEDKMARWRGKNLGIVFQFFQLLPVISVIENIMLPMDFSHTYPMHERHDRAMELLKLVEVADHAHKLPTALSGGQQQRVAIARALANDPPLIIADEPTGNLDSKTAESIFALFNALVAKGKTIIIVTHDSGLAKRTPRTTLIADGEIVNEYVAKAMPTLSHDQLLRATRQATRQLYDPGAMILKEGTKGNLFYIVSQGDVDVILERNHAANVIAAQMGPGQYFGEMEFLHGQGRSASIRASERGGKVEVLTLDFDTLRDLLDKSEPTREAIEHVAQQRQEQNVELRASVR
ncbi:MAG TPA: ATP-binding cassette domain-containing protein [Anaerolineales bacterium]|nr:ATP-binding cassette domain-containing protein [Anaerolineales bacterium]